MKILIDAMSGDNAPSELLRGAALAAESYPEEILVCGDEAVILETAKKERIDLSRLGIVHAPQVIDMEDDALSAVRSKSDSSMARGLQMLAENKGDAFVSAGNTGALVAGATLIVRKIRGIRRAAIGTVLPFDPPLLLLDSGANIEVLPEDYVQFAQLGSVYMERVFGRRSPRVGLLNNGTEPTKGGKLRTEAHRLLSETAGINFIGNVEAREVPFSPCDVLVADGFTGNAVLKLSEGLGNFLFGKLKETLTADFLTKAYASLLLPKMRRLKREFSASEYGGAPLLGISRPVIKAHGSSDAEAIKNAVRQAIAVVSSGVIPGMASAATRKSPESKKTEQEDGTL